MVKTAASAVGRTKGAPRSDQVRSSVASWSSAVVSPSGGDAVDPRVEGQRRGPRRAVLDAALPGRIGQPPCIHLLGEVVGGEPEADDRVRRHRGGHAATVRRHPVVVGTETTKIWLTR